VRCWGAWGSPSSPVERVTDADAALAAAERLGWPVVLKAADERWRNRVDAGAVRLALAGPDDLRAAWRDVQAVIGSGVGSEAFVQPMARPGVSTVVRLVQDPSAGPLLSLRSAAWRSTCSSTRSPERCR
jgi:acetyltransferase